MPSNTEAFSNAARFNLCNDDDLTNLAAKCQEFESAVKSKAHPRWISILGNTGTGKTHMARHLWYGAEDEHDWSRFDYYHKPIYWPAFVSDLRSGESYKQLREMMRWPVLFLDDICAERDTSGFASEQLNTLLGSRDGRWTIITSNLALHQIAAVEPRIADRMIRSPNICVEVQTTSYAIRNLQPASS